MTIPTSTQMPLSFLYPNPRAHRLQLFDNGLLGSSGCGSSPKLPYHASSLHKVHGISALRGLMPYRGKTCSPSQSKPRYACCLKGNRPNDQQGCLRPTSREDRISSAQAIDKIKEHIRMLKCKKRQQKEEGTEVNGTTQHLCRIQDR